MQIRRTRFSLWTMTGLMWTGLALCGSARGQANPVPPPAKPLAYEVVSVKVNKSESGNSSWSSTPSGIKMENIRLRDLITSAYALRSPMNEQVSGLPKWADDLHFDLEAKVSDEDLEAFKKLKYEQQAPLLLAALQDRFKLKAHEETRELPLYSLVVAKGGPKLKPAKEGDTYENGLKFNEKTAGPGSMSMHMDGSAFEAEFQGVPIQNVADNVAYQVKRQVTDETGLTGKYDVKLEWSPEDAKDTAIPGIFTALQEQLGLKLVPTKGPVRCVVVEHVEEPTAN